MKIINFLREIRRRLSFAIREIRNGIYRLMGVEVGKNVFISRGAWIDTQDGKVIIEDHVRITNGCKVLSHDYSVSVMGRKPIMATTIIKERAFIGMNVVILPGVIIGEGSVIGAGCVISEDVPANSLVVGIKPRVIKEKNLETGAWERVKEDNLG